MEFGEEEFGRWGFCRSLPGGKPAGDSASQHPGYPPETPGFCGGSFRTPTLGLGVPHIPHLLVPRPRRPWLLVPDLALGTSPPFPEGQAPRGAVAGAGSAGLRAAGRSWRGRTGRGAPTGLGFLSPSSETARAEGGGRCSFLLACHSRFHPIPFMRPTAHSYRSHSFQISASGHSAFEVHLLCASEPWAASESHSAEGIPAPLSLPHLDDKDDGTGGSQD